MRLRFTLAHLTLLDVFMNALKRALAAIGFRSASPGAITPGKAAERSGFAAAGRRQPLWLAYSLPFITTAVTLLVVEAAARDVPGKTPVIVFVFPILLSAYVGGLAPGLLATVLSTLATFYYVLPPAHTWSVANPADNIKWITLAGCGDAHQLSDGAPGAPGPSRWRSTPVTRGAYFFPRSARSGPVSRSCWPVSSQSPLCLIPRWSGCARTPPGWNTLTR